jgi:hypothetical protein
MHCVMLHFQRSVTMPDKLEAFLEVLVCEQSFSKANTVKSNTKIIWTLQY